MDGSGANYTIDSYIGGLASDETDLFVSKGSGTSAQFLRIALQTGTVTPYTTVGATNNFYVSYGIDKVGDSLFAPSSNKIFEIKLAGTDATVSEITLDISGINTTYFPEMVRNFTAFGGDLYVRDMMGLYLVSLEVGVNETTGTVSEIEPNFTASSYYNTGLEAQPLSLIHI